MMMKMMMIGDLCDDNDDGCGGDIEDDKEYDNSYYVIKVMMITCYLLFAIFNMSSYYLTYLLVFCLLTYYSVTLPIYHSGIHHQ